MVGNQWGVDASVGWQHDRVQSTTCREGEISCPRIEPDPWIALGAPPLLWPGPIFVPHPKGLRQVRNNSNINTRANENSNALFIGSRCAKQWLKYQIKSILNSSRKNLLVIVGNQVVWKWIHVPSNNWEGSLGLGNRIQDMMANWL